MFSKKIHAALAAVNLIVMISLNANPFAGQNGNSFVTRSHSLPRSVNRIDLQYDLSDVANWSKALSEVDQLRARARQMEKEGRTLVQMPDRTYLDGRTESRRNERARGQQLEAEAAVLQQQADQIEGDVRNAKSALIAKPDSETLTGMRVWSSRNGGATITGRVINFTGSMLTMHRDDGEFFLMPINLLSDADHDLLKELLAINAMRHLGGTKSINAKDFPFLSDMPHRNWAFKDIESQIQGRLFSSEGNSVIILSDEGMQYRIPVSRLAEASFGELEKDKVLLNSRVSNEKRKSYRYEQMRKRSRAFPYLQWEFTGNDVGFQGRIIGFNKGTVILESINGALYEIEEPLLIDKYLSIVSSVKQELYLEPVGAIEAWIPPDETPTRGELICFDAEHIRLRSGTEIISIKRSTNASYYDERLQRWTQTPDRLRERIRMAHQYSSAEISFRVGAPLSFNSFPSLKRYGSAIFEILINGDLAILVTRDTGFMSSGYTSLPLSVVGYHDIVYMGSQILTVPIVVEGKRLDEVFVSEMASLLEQILAEIEIMEFNQEKMVMLSR